MKKQKTITECPKCGSGCLWHRPGGTILCTVCMTVMDKEGKPCINPKTEESGN